MSYSKLNFKFNNKNFKAHIHLLAKYYPFVPITFTTDGHYVRKGLISEIQPCMGNTYHVESNEFWNMSAIKTFPRQLKLYNEKNTIVDNIKKAIDLKLMYSYSDLGLNLNYDDIHGHSVVKAIKSLDNELITHAYCYDDEALIVVKDKHALKVERGNIREISLPRFDFTNGYTVDDLKLSRKLNKHFKLWSEKFKQTNGETWDNPVVISEN